MLLVAMNRVCLRGNGRTAQTEWYGGGGGWAIKWRVRFGYKCQSSFTTAIYFLQETFAWSPTPPPPPPPLPRLTDVGVFLQRSCREDRPLSPSKLSLLAIRPFPSLCPVLHAFHYLHFSPCFPSAFISPCFPSAFIFLRVFPQALCLSVFFPSVSCFPSAFISPCFPSAFISLYFPPCFPSAFIPVRVFPQPSFPFISLRVFPQP